MRTGVCALGPTLSDSWQRQVSKRQRESHFLFLVRNLSTGAYIAWRSR